ncbi:23S rRNA (uracil(1939)-C(5))-methyltransferase RlmD [Azotosporobacter soli]|uniref:23S rRNA (uracil(1939)-C(5))-methyltransferase RlmD n=1 Tax=Azotosporobacter soli TaxID=3055040 RepID=UPI0031FE5CB2
MSEKIIPVVKEREYEIEISGLGHSGEGVGKYQGFTVFVPYALPQETVRVRIEKVKKTYAIGRLQKVLKESVNRRKPPCPVYYQCGGCQLQHLNYVGQLNVKRDMVVAAVARIGKLDSVPVFEVLGAADEWNYRNKMQFPIGKDGKKTLCGCYAAGSHRVIDIESCLIQRSVNDRIAQAVKQYADRFKVEVYNEESGRGVLRHVMGRSGNATGEALAVIVTSGAVLPKEQELVKLLREVAPELVGIVQNINDRQTNVVLGTENRTLWGRDMLKESLGPLTFSVSPHSFFQVNTKQALRLYETALEYANLSGSETVIDAYCGTGTISLFLAQKAAKVYGFEIVEAAIRDANKNAQENDVSNALFQVGDVVETLPKLVKSGVRPDVIVVDPPRAGCAQPVLEMFAAMQPERIVYVSCNPASLARDLAILAEQGYKTAKIQPVDMFPQTFHVESVALLERG